MKQDYLTPFLKHLSLQMPEQVSEYITTVGIEDIVQKGGEGDDDDTETKPEGDKNDESVTKALAEKIANAIVSGLKKSNKYLEERNKRKKKIEADKNKIKRMTMVNPIDMNYGGGLLVFGPDFNIKKMIHMFYIEKAPMYFSTEIGEIMDNNVVNQKLKKKKTYSSANIANEIKTVIE